MKRSLHILSLMSLTLTLLIQPITYANAQIANSSCDPNYYASLRARAWLEAQREITQNNSIIQKPDSVLQYSCYDRYLSVIATELAQYASGDSLRWGMFQPTVAGRALAGLIAEPMQRYLQSNFGVTTVAGAEHGYRLMGGRATTDLSSATGAINENGFYQLSAITMAYQGYTCDVMDRVWEASRCGNFIDNPATDAFYTFDQYATLSSDPRSLSSPALSPGNSSCPGPTPVIVGGNTVNAWEYNIGVSVGGINGQQDRRLWTQDNVQTYFSSFIPNGVTIPGGSAATCADSPIVTTGLTINGTPEAVCIRPGCTYNPNASPAPICE